MIFEGAMAFLSRQYRTIGALAIVTAVGVARARGLDLGWCEAHPVRGRAGELRHRCRDRALAGGTAHRYRLPRRAPSARASPATSGCSSPCDRTYGPPQPRKTASRTLSRSRFAVAPYPGFLVVALSLLGVSGIFLVYSRILDHPPEIAPFLIVGFGFGASFVALFAQLGRRYLHQGG